MKPVKPITHVIFDLDGTILDTETLYRMAYRKVSHGFIFTRWHIERLVMALSLQDGIQKG
jgi:beta-phosphoglucomutase-like phosphatase (HAD superfamily)